MRLRICIVVSDLIILVAQGEKMGQEHFASVYKQTVNILMGPMDIDIAKTDTFPDRLDHFTEQVGYYVECLMFIHLIAGQV